MNSILAQIQDYLQRAQQGPVEMPEDIIEQFGEACKVALRRQFTEEKQKFTLRMSTIGRPLCQLKLEAQGVEPELPPYNVKFRNLLGDLIEAAGVAVMRAAKVRIDSVQRRVQLPIAGINLSGTYDVEIEGKIYDVKSASPYSFVNTFGKHGGFHKLSEDDHFGYVAQGYTYSQAEKKPFGGWIVINKATGEWNIVETPSTDDHHRKAILERVEHNISAIRNNEPFKREFTDVVEEFRGKPTGNKILNSICGFCNYRKHCWPEANLRPQALSKAKLPRMMYYTKFDEAKYGKQEETKQENQEGSGDGPEAV